MASNVACFRPVDVLSDESDAEPEAAAAGSSECQHSETASEVRLAKSDSFGDVTELSDEDLGPTFESGGSLPSSLPISNPKKRKRSTRAAEYKEKRLSEENIRRLLSSACSKGCKLKCYAKFHVLLLKKFREDWLALHKLDQDQIVACQCHEAHLVIFCVN